MNTTTYGRMTQAELMHELDMVSNTLASRHRELGSITQDYNNEFYHAYVRAPSSSVAAKEREVNYQCLTILNDLALIEAELKSLEVMRTLILTLLPYAN
jgi:hypothetical protein